jgi:hypothetical protein
MSSLENARKIRREFSFAGKQLVHFLITQAARETRFHRNAGKEEGGHFCVRLLERLINNGGNNFDNLLS